MQKNALRKIFEKHVYQTPEKEVVFVVKNTVGRLPAPIRKLVGHSLAKVHISTRTLKHLYDKRSAEEFDLIIDNLELIIENPDACYRNRSGKRGNFCIVKNMNGTPHLVLIEIVASENKRELQIATAFRARYRRYLKHYELLWGRRGDNHSS